MNIKEKNKDEIVDIYNPDTFDITGEVISKNTAHKLGIWHGSIHVIIVNEDKTKSLFQQRASDKSLYPDMLDIAVGGDISIVEKDCLAGRRELNEELGIDPNTCNIKFLKKYREELNYRNINNKEIVSIFILYKDIDIKDIVLQQEEVRDARWITKEEMDALINLNKTIPHKEEYKILRKVLK